MDWSGCNLVEVVPGKVSGKPIVAGTRIPADLVLDYYDHGTTTEEMLEDYPGLSNETIEALIGFAKSQRMRAAS